MLYTVMRWAMHMRVSAHTDVEPYGFRSWQHARRFLDVAFGLGHMLDTCGCCSCRPEGGTVRCAVY